MTIDLNSNDQSEIASTDDTVEEVIALFLNKVDAKLRPAASKFARGFFGRTVYADIRKLPTEVISGIVLDLWTFFLKRKPDQAKINIYDLKLDTKEGGTRVIINIANDNMPFLLDSFIGYLGRLGVRARVIRRPVYRVLRDKAGTLKEVMAREESVEGSILESIIHCEITEPVSLETMKTLKADLPHIQRDIAYTVGDWRAMRAKVQEAIKNLKPLPSVLSADETAEVIDFLQWIDSDHFTFLGYREYDLTSREKFFHAKFKARSGLGILKNIRNQDIGTFYHGVPLGAETMRFIFQSDPLIVTKTIRTSTVHRVVPMDSISIKKFDDKGNVVGLQQFLGLFTSIAYSSSARDIPLLRRKVLRVVEKAGFLPQGHDGKALIHVLDTLPRDELFQASESELLEIGLKVLAIQERPRVALFIRRDHFDRFLSCLVYIPRDRFDYELTERIGIILQEELGCLVKLRSAQYGNLTFARAHYMGVTAEVDTLDYDVEKIEKKLRKAAHSWREGLRSALVEEFGDWEGAQVYQKYSGAFKKGYQESFDEAVAVEDIKYIEKANQENQLQIKLYRPEGAPMHAVRLKLYHPGSSIPLSDVLPTLENMDLNVRGEVPHMVSPAGEQPVWIHDFDTINLGECPIDIGAIEQKFLDMFGCVWTRQVENDGFNRLVIRAGLNWRECTVIRAYSKYLRQLQIPFSQTYMEETLVKNPEITRYISELFTKRLDPKGDKDCQKQAQDLSEQIAQLLNKVENPDEDRILRRFTNLVMATVRSNYFHQPNKPYLSFKLDSRVIDDLPLPKPLFEIYIYSPGFEAVHLRGGKIARGGIRWSDRREDFRTEILGLMKAQMVKNAIIIPVGSKGGFILKTSVASMTRSEMFAEGIKCYKQMMRAMLEITDNLVKGKVRHPKHTKCLDQDDAYLVVAADKGTATFSDYANDIANELGFWLGDAFASGGSAGYDHKIMGITARGAWESVKRHYWEMGVDPNKAKITAVGIGDMSGDVFGNGMLCSENLQLIAAFNHRHIFIDPTPDPATSFRERKRLFDLAKGWDEYDSELISLGGGVYNRSAKSIKVSAKVKKLFDLPTIQVTPDALVQAILKSRVDLLWFGGIGTFVKSRFESNAEVGDRSNDAIRVNAKDLRCKIIGEGANLAITQRARISFARAGGHINTDAIDNSGGVDCSDHEVNIKILLQDVMADSKLSMKSRNKLLEKMTDMVADHVLHNNYNQNLAISLVHTQGPRLLDQQMSLMHGLEKKAKLDRILESLPDDTVMAEYQAAQIGLSRPELGVLLPYAKNSLYESIVDSSLPSEPILAGCLTRYFPAPLRKKYSTYINRHPLKHEIISTVATNHVVNRMGGSFINELEEKTGRSADDIMRTYFMVLDIYGLGKLWEDIDALEYQISAKNQVKAFLRLLWLIKRITGWFLQNFPAPMDVAKISELFKQGVRTLDKSLEECLVIDGKRHLEKDKELYKRLGLDSELAERIARIEVIASSPDIVLIADQNKASVLDVTKLYFALGARFSFGQLRHMIERLVSTTPWQRLAENYLFEDLFIFQGRLTAKVLQSFIARKKALPKRGADAVSEWVKAHAGQVAHIDQLITDSKAEGTPNLAMLSVLQRELRVLSE